MAANKPTIPPYDGLGAKGLSFLNPGAEYMEQAPETGSLSTGKPKRKMTGRRSKSEEVSASDKAKTSLYISKETLHDLRVHCADTGIPMTEFVEDAVKDKLKMEKKKKAKEDRNNGIEE